MFEDLLSHAGPGPLTILDVGGKQEFWEAMNFTKTPHRIILLNLFESKVRHPGFVSIVGDGCNLGSFADQSVDIVFSNSVIEHVETFANQQRMAGEIRRVGKRYFVQTPSFYFPIEPHFICPFFHWMPFSMRVWLLRRFSLGYIRRQPTKELAANALREFRLLDRKEVRDLFPDSVLHSEKILGLTKSYIAVKQ